MFGNQRIPLASRSVFICRLSRSLAMSIVLISLSLAAGVAGYHWISGLLWVDAFLNASMILGGMGPVEPMDVHSKATAASKIFAACYALFSGLVLLARLVWFSGRCCIVLSIGCTLTILMILTTKRRVRVLKSNALTDVIQRQQCLTLVPLGFANIPSSLDRAEVPAAAGIRWQFQPKPPEGRTTNSNQLLRNTILLTFAAQSRTLFSCSDTK